MLSQKNLRFGYAAIILLWCCIQFYFFYRFGARLSVDSSIYLQDAETIFHGHIQEGRSIWYSGYSIFLAGVLAIGGTITTAVIIQIALAGLALLYVAKCADKLFHNSTAGMFAAFLVTIWVPIHEWNTFIYTESLFTSFCIFCFASLLLARRHWHYAVSAALLLIAFFLRPNGFGLIVAFISYVFIGIKQARGKQLAFTFLMPLFVASFFLLNRMLADYELIESYANGELVYPNAINFESVPDNLIIPEKSYPPSLRVVLFAVNNPLYFLKLFFTKLFLFFGSIKPYFSIFHNALIVIILYPAYYFAVRGYKNIEGHNGEKIFFLTFIAFQALTVALASENWDGRFLVPVLPFVFILASGAVAKTVKRLIGQMMK